MSVEVSILMPTLNSLRFLEERIESIRSQTLEKWELLVADSHSDDGTWETLQDHQQRDTRFRLFRVPREGVYRAINFLLERAKGRYIYIATSDDTMSSHCLAHMRGMLDRHPDCDICHSSLKVIDAEGNEIEGWWRERPATKYFGDLENKTHIRYAPHDGILHICLSTVYGSLTQLLVRRSAFEKIGVFRSDWGPSGDFEWGMRAGIMCNTIHTPEVLATWRIHEKQLTRKPRGDLLTKMTKAALPYLEEEYPELYRSIDLKRLLSYYKRLEVLQHIQRSEGWPARMGSMARCFVRYPGITMRVLAMAARGESVRQSVDRISFLREHMEHLELNRLVKSLDEDRNE